MPGPYARVMREERQMGRYPEFLLTLMLFRNSMKDYADEGSHDLNHTFFVVSWNTLPSCHPMALRFMNMVSDANYPNDEATSHEKRDDAANEDAAQGAAAIKEGKKAVWVTYGHHEGHSFVLLSSHDDQVESFEGWAGGNVDD